MEDIDLVLLNEAIADKLKELLPAGFATRPERLGAMLPPFAFDGEAGAGELANAAQRGFDADATTIVVNGPIGRGFLTFQANVEANVEHQGLAASIERAAEYVLDRLQDAMTEWLTVPWPADAESGRFVFAGGRAQVLDGILSMWYQGRNGPVTPVIAIELQSFRRKGQ